MLRHELDRVEPGLAQLLRRRASAWHRQHGTVAEAIDLVIEAGDLSDASGLIAAHWSELLDEGLAETLQNWIDQLPPEVVAADGEMCVIRAALASFRGHAEDMDLWLEAAQTAVPQSHSQRGPASVESVMCFYRALHQCLDGDLAAAELTARRAAELELESGNDYWRARTLALLGTILFWRGKQADAGLLLELVTRAGRRPTDNLTNSLALSCMAALRAAQGDRDCAERYAREIASPPACGILVNALTQAERGPGEPEPAAPPRGRSKRSDGLSAREAEVLSLLTWGHTNLEIADQLVVSVHTVERHLQNAYRKLGVRNRADAAAYMARDRT